jgi:hypothetical protein
MNAIRRSTALAIAGMLLLVGCAKGATTVGSPTSSSTTPVESPVPAESSPPGDIPDDQAFVPYSSQSGGFTISVPEGWARSTSKHSVSFTDKLNTITVTWTSATPAPTVASATSTEVPQLQQTERAFALRDVTSASLPAGDAVLVSFQENSEPNSVTGNQYRMDVLRYELFADGTEAVITLSSPAGADNVDPWRIVTESFAWA